MIIILAVSVLPPLYLLWRVYQSDKIEKEPVGLLFTIFLYGMLSTLPAGILESVGELFAVELWPNWSETRAFNLVFYFLVVGGAEELAKFYAMKIPTWKNSEFDFVFDGVVYGVTAALGFAALENIFYVTDSGLGTAGIRAWTAIPLHCITGIFMGHYYGIAKAADVWGDPVIRRKMLRRSVLIPMMIHGAYDFIAVDGSEIFSILFFVYIIILDIFAFRALRRYSDSDVRLY